MKTIKFLFVTLLISSGLTGCYTQLEYSERMKRVSDDEPVEGYSWNEDSDENAYPSDADSIYMAETHGAKEYDYTQRQGLEDEYYDAAEEEEYVPVYYKDYGVDDTWEACNCNPYSSFDIRASSYDPWYGGSGSIAIGYGRSWNRYHHGYAYSHYPRSFYRFHHRPHPGCLFYGSRFSIAFGYGWGYPYYDYYDPFFYDPFYYGYAGYYHPYSYNSFWGYYGGYYGYNYRRHVGFTGVVRSNRSDVRYGRRSIGTNRVSTTGRSRNSVQRSAERRSRSRVDYGTDTRTRVRSSSDARTRSRTQGTVERSRSGSSQPRSRGTSRVGTSGRSRSGSDANVNGSRDAVKRTRSRDNDTGGRSVRSRSAESVQRDRATSSVGISRQRVESRNRSRSLLLDRSDMESRIRRQRVKEPEPDRRRSSFFGRFKNMFDTRSRINNTNRSNTPTFRSPNNSNNNSRTIIRSRSSSNSRGSSVTRSRSRSSSESSSRSRSRGSSSRSRDRN